MWCSQNGRLWTDEFVVSQSLILTDFGGGNHWRDDDVVVWMVQVGIHYIGPGGFVILQGDKPLVKWAVQLASEPVESVIGTVKRKLFDFPENPP